MTIKVDLQKLRCSLILDLIFHQVQLVRQLVDLLGQQELLGVSLLPQIWPQAIDAELLLRFGLRWRPAEGIDNLPALFVVKAEQLLFLLLSPTPHLLSLHLELHRADELFMQEPHSVLVNRLGWLLIARNVLVELL